MEGLFDRVVDARVQKLLRREREILVTLREALETEQADERRRIDELLEGLDDLFRLVVVGEFNAGKSSLLNALFGQKLRAEGPIPVDDVISILRFGEEPKTRPLGEFVVEQTYPVEFLRNIVLVDTPGTNAIVARHQEITEDFIPRADLVLFVTSIDRPLSESERRFLEYIRNWGKKVIFVVTKIDTKTDEEIDQVLDYVKRNIAAIFGFDPVVFPVAPKLALEAKLGTVQPREWTRSRFEPLEDYIFNVLSEKERLHIKLSAPLDTVATVMARQNQMLVSRRKVLESDHTHIRAISGQLELAERDLRQSFEQFVVRIDNMLMELEKRGVDFLDRYVRINHILLLRDASRFRDEFQRQVFQEWDRSIDRTIQESVDWLVKENMKLWRDTVEEFHRRARQNAPSHLIGTAGREFAYNRDEVYARIRGEAERRIQSYNVEIESRRTIDGAMQGVLQTFGLGAGALGLGYVFTTAFSSVAVDVTGLTAATMLLVTSFLILPYKRSKAKEQFKARIDELRAQLKEALTRESANEIGRMIASIRAAFEPYQRFYEIESGKIAKFSEKLATVDYELAALRSEIG